MAACSFTSDYASPVGYIYVLIDPRTSQVRYVGQTIDIVSRYRNHVNRNRTGTETSYNYKDRWIMSLLTKKLKPIVEVVECVNLNDLDIREKYWITFYSNLVGKLLTNATSGGECYRIISEEDKKKRSKFRQGLSIKKPGIDKEYIGVRKRYGYKKEDTVMFSAHISYNKQSILLCSFPDKKLCAYYYDCAALHLYGKTAKTNGIGTNPLSLLEIRRQVALKQKVDNNYASPYLGVTVSKGMFTSRIQLDKEKVEITRSKSDVVCARMYDACARYYFGTEAVTNFPGVTALSVEEARKLQNKMTKEKQKSSYNGVTASQSKAYPWNASLRTKENKLYNIGNFATEEEAAIAYDACCRYYLPHKNTNFSGDLKLSIEEAREHFRKKTKSSSYYGVSLQSNGRYNAYHCKNRKKTNLGSFTDEVEAAKAVDKYLLQNQIDHKLNFPELREDYEKVLFRSTI